MCQDCCLQHTLSNCLEGISTMETYIFVVEGVAYNGTARADAASARIHPYYTRSELQWLRQSNRPVG